MLLGSFGYANADHSNQRVLDGAVLLGQNYCTDNVSEQSGMCQLFQNGEVRYLVFMREDRIQFIRRIREGGYDTIYVLGEVSA